MRIFYISEFLIIMVFFPANSPNRQNNNLTKVVVYGTNSNDYGYNIIYNLHPQY